MKTGTPRISLRTRQLKSGNKLLFLDFRLDGGRHREALSLQLVPEVTKADADHNKAVLAEAEAIRQKRLEELAYHDCQIEKPVIAPSSVVLSDMIDEFEKSYRDKGDSITAANVCGMRRAVEAFRGLTITLSEIDKEYCDRLVDFLANDYHSPKGKLKMTSARAYIYLFSSALNLAVEHGHINLNPLRLIKIHNRITRERPKKQHLTHDEVRMLMETQCPVISRPQVKQAYMLALFTGLSEVDVTQIHWKHLKETEGKHTVVKASRGISVPVPDVALRYIPDTTNHRGLLFKGLPKSTEINNILKLWQKKAGIDRFTLNFTVARNTYAYMLLSAGVDVATLCSLMGISHKQAKGYLKMVDYQSPTPDDKMNFLQL